MTGRGTYLYLLGWDLDEAVQGIHIPQDNDAAFSTAVELAARPFDSRDAGRVARIGYLARRERRAGHGLRNDRARRLAA